MNFLNNIYRTMIKRSHGHSCDHVTFDCLLQFIYAIVHKYTVYI